MQWIADRFFTDDQGRWIDLASGSPVRLHVSRSGPPGADIEWSDWCARLARLRHPALNPLLDYGAASAIQRFEAYETGPGAAQGRGPAWAGLPLLLESAGLILDDDRARLAVRRAGGA